MVNIELRETDPVPQGLYTVQFDSIEETETSFGKALRFFFNIVDNPQYDGRKVNVIAATYASSKNKTGKLVTKLTGDIKNDVNEALGNKYKVYLKINENGYNTLDVDTLERGSAKKK